MQSQAESLKLESQSHCSLSTKLPVPFGCRAINPHQLGVLRFVWFWKNFSSDEDPRCDDQVNRSRLGTTIKIFTDGARVAAGENSEYASRASLIPNGLCWTMQHEENGPIMWIYKYNAN